MNLAATLRRLQVDGSKSRTGRRREDRGVEWDDHGTRRECQLRCGRARHVVRDVSSRTEGAFFGGRGTDVVLHMNVQHRLDGPPVRKSESVELRCGPLSLREIGEGDIGMKRLRGTCAPELNADAINEETRKHDE